ncbi:hypothetical protein QR680_017438 [Steinernema hermaphroditum]|uniref:Ig-like domain-containing protein n=1 Tax=Steinernema hermaphroditum TaxID=289476 RepID=A0AA39HGY1_9BILA|nr:hypothetical protein QR680_017438 [Steinernema hermaphroditum]
MTGPSDRSNLSSFHCPAPLGLYFVLSPADSPHHEEPDLLAPSGPPGTLPLIPCIQNPFESPRSSEKKDAPEILIEMAPDAPRILCAALVLAALSATMANVYVNPTPLANAELPPAGMTSLAFVFDKTGSMYDDLQQVRTGAKRIFETVFKQHRRLIHNYVLVAFHDPEVDPPFVSSDPIAFQAELGRVHVNGGGDCPEMTLGGIKKALEVSLPASYIYVFTDALSKDYHLEDQVVGLIQQKQSSVVFVMTGDCGNRTHPGYIVFEKIAAASFGQVFHLTKADVKTVLEYVRSSIAQRKVHVLYEVRERGGANQRAIPIDSGMTELTLSLAGQREDGDFLEMTLIDPKGNKVERSQYANESGTIDLRNVKLMKISDPLPGVWRIHTSSRLKHTLRIFGHGTIDFKYGFAAKPVSRIQLTHNQPVASQPTFLHVNLTGLEAPGRAQEISLVDFHGKVLYSAKAKRDSAAPHLFYVAGEDAKAFDFQRIAPTSVSSIRATGPRAYMAETTTTTVLGSVNLTCSVESRSPFTVYWKRGGQTIGGPLFYQSSEVAIWPLHQVTQANRGHYECFVAGEHGNHSAKTFLDTREPPPYISALRDEAVVREAPAFVHCQTQSSGHVFYEWRKNGRLVANSSRLAVYPNGTLHIFAAQHTDEGEYECHVRTPGGVASGTARLTVLERPFATVAPKTLHFVPSREFKLSCDVSGTPRPETQWFFRGKRLTHDNKYYISYRGDLIVRSANSEDVGVYECRAVNPAGEATDFSSVYLAVPPKVRMVEGRKMFGRGEAVVLDCQVLGGSPQPRIIWFKGGHTLHNNAYIKISGESRLTIQGVRESDAGNYSCMAENIAGRDAATTFFEVGTVPTIVGLSEQVRAHIERKLLLPCRAIGYPAPKTQWKRNGVPVEEIDTIRYNVLSDGSLRINSVLIEDQTYFTCTAKNSFGAQDKNVHVIVEGLVSPVLSHVSPEMQMIQGQDLRLSCHILIGTPKPKIEWFRDGRLLEESSNIIIQGGGASVLLRGGRPELEGLYTCAASNAGGNATVNINIQLIKPPTIAGAAPQPEEVAVQNGDTLRIPCDVTAYPRPAVEWSLDDRPISANSAEYTIAPDFALHIHKLSEEHVGRFMCRVKNAAGEAQKATIVEVHAPPVIAPAQTSYNLIKGESVVLPCEVKIGKPAPEIAWFFENEPVAEELVDDDGSLFVDGVDERRRGKYRCVARNAIGRDERVLTVTVHTAPQIEGSRERKTVVLKVNETAVLPCPANAHPPPRRVWSYEGQRIYRATHLGSRVQHTPEGVFVLEGVQIKHSGTYVCHVSNLAGSDNITYHLTVQEPPRIVSDVPDVVDVVLDLYLEVPCRAIGIPDPHISWEKDGFAISSDSDQTIDADGTLRIPNVQVRHKGVYRCMAINVAGSDARTTQVVVQEPPVILERTKDERTEIEGTRIELRCFVSANPPAMVTWRYKGLEISSDNERFTQLPDGTLVVEEVRADDLGFYTCRAENIAGFDEKNIRLTVISVPEIPDFEKLAVEKYVLGDSFSLFCPVISTPLPDIFWEFDGHPIAESAADKHLVVSEDRRRLHVNQSRVADVGVYKCVARNKAGQTEKSFQIDINVPPTIDEAYFKRHIRALEESAVEIGCPVTGHPTPKITWFVDGVILNREKPQKGMVLSEDGALIAIANVQTFHEGTFLCFSTNDAGSLDVDVELIVLAAPKVGADETVEAKSGQPATLVCDVENDDEKTSIIWLFNGTEKLPETVQVPHNRRRLFILSATPKAHRGRFECRVRNSIGGASKFFDLAVLEAPEFVEKHVDSSVQLVLGAEGTLSCAALGFPEPSVEWRRRGELVVEGLEKGGHELRVTGATGADVERFTCEAKNSVGVVSRDFFVQTILPPKKAPDAAEQEALEVIEGHAVSLVCPIVSLGEGLAVEWLKDGKPTEDALSMTADRIRLVVVNAKPKDRGVYTCVARNAAGQASHAFDLEVIAPPRIEGSTIEVISVLEGRQLQMACMANGEPKPTIAWTKKGTALVEHVERLSDGQIVVVREVRLEDGGNYVCHVENKAGVVEKTFAIDVVAKPRLVGSEAVNTVEGHRGAPFTFECLETTQSSVEILWLRDEIPIVTTVDGPKVMAGGRTLHIPHLDPEDDGVYTCVARNEAGEAKRAFKLDVLVPPKIINEGGRHTIIENNSLVLPCEVEGNPRPRIGWTKDGRPADAFNGLQTLNDGQQLKILSASEAARGVYLCTASNKVAAVDISFDVDVMTRPTLSQDVEDTIEVDQRENAYFTCPLVDKNFQGEILWTRDFTQITVDGVKYHLSKSATRLHLLEAQVEDEGTYSCSVKNEAGETRIDFRLVVNTSPVIGMLEKDKNRTVVENGTMTISCVATGKPEPTIEWYKDGELLVPENVTRKIRHGRIGEAGISISRIQKPDAGRYTCEAKNKAGIAEQDVSVFVMTPPQIERQGIPAEVSGELEKRLTMSCPAFGVPTPSVTWLKAGRPLDNENDIYFSANGQKLHFIRLSREDASKYTCIAKNAAGEDKRDFVLRLLEEPRIEGPNIMRRIQTNAGRTATIVCPATGSPEPTISWLRNGKALEKGTSERFVLLDGGRQLQIVDARASDAARYTCIATNVVGTADLDALLIIVAKPSIQGEAAETREIVLNRAFHLLCDVEGTEPIDIEWQRLGRALEISLKGGSNYLQISMRGKKMDILSARREDEGRVSCVARNDAGEARKHFDLVLLVPPTINDSLSSDPVQTAIPGQPFNVSCHVEAIPEAHIEWSLDGKPLAPASEGAEDALYVALDGGQTLWVRRSAEKGIGKFTCRASNKAGSAQREFFIRTTGPPVVDQAEQKLEVAVDEFVVLDCKVQAGAGNVSAAWFLADAPLKESKALRVAGTKVELRKVRLSDSGKYARSTSTCRSRHASSTRRIRNRRSLSVGR